MQIATSEATEGASIELEALRHITVREENNGFVVSLTDDMGFETVRGYGNSPTEALNDLHRNLI
ncbi:MAG: hypothetical protein K9J17_01435 [Flavobacteriales bacterium]|nr:hypothetical protein [Flavobacteriales bacterium]